MPELPEVHTIASDIKKNLLGYSIEAVSIENGYKVVPNKNDFIKMIVKSTIGNVGRVGKNIVIKLSNGNFLTFHLAMTGRILLRVPDAPKDPYQRVQLHLAREKDTFLLRYCDLRMFGKVSAQDTNGITELKKKYGPDMAFDNPSLDDFLFRVKAKNTSIKIALMEQSIVAGLGNIYVTDALWMAKIHPEKKTSLIDDKQGEALLKAAKEILHEGIKHRGSTLPDEAYVDIYGKPGSHQKYFRIYGKTICPACGTTVEYKKINGRGTYFCPVCQK